MQRAGAFVFEPTIYIYIYVSRCKRTSSCLVSRRTVREIEEKQARGDAFQDLATPCSHNIATTRTIKCLGSGHRRDIKSGGGKIPSFPPLALGKNLFLFLFFFPLFSLPLFPYFYRVLFNGGSCVRLFLFKSVYVVLFIHRLASKPVHV